MSSILRGRYIFLPMLLLLLGLLLLPQWGQAFLHPLEPHLARNPLGGAGRSSKIISACGVDNARCIAPHIRGASVSSATSSSSSVRELRAVFSPSLSVAGEIAHQIPITLNLETPVLRAMTSTVSAASQVVADVSSRVIPAVVGSAITSLRSSVLPPLLSRAALLASPLLFKPQDNEGIAVDVSAVASPMSPVSALTESPLVRAAAAKAVVSSPRITTPLLRADAMIRRFFARILPRPVAERLARMSLGRFALDHASNLADIYAGNAIAKAAASALLDDSAEGAHKYVDLAERLSYTLYAGYAANCAYKFAAEVVRSPDGSDSDDSRLRAHRFAADRAVQLAIGASTVIASANDIATATGSSVSSLIAVGGLSSAALALASKDVSTNLVGGAMLLASRPLAAGDHVSAKLGGVEISGTVAGVGLLQTRLINKDGRTVYVPNGLFLQAAVTNNNRTVDHDETPSYCSPSSASIESPGEGTSTHQMYVMDMSACNSDAGAMDSGDDSDFDSDFSDYSDSESDYHSATTESESESDSDYSDDDEDAMDSESEAEAGGAVNKGFGTTNNNGSDAELDTDSESDYSDYSDSDSSDYDDPDSDYSDSDSDYSDYSDSDSDYSDSDSDSDEVSESERDSGSESSDYSSDDDYTDSESDYSSSSDDDGDDGSDSVGSSDEGCSDSDTDIGSDSDTDSDSDSDSDVPAVPLPVQTPVKPAAATKVPVAAKPKPKAAPASAKTAKKQVGGKTGPNRVWGKFGEEK